MNLEDERFLEVHNEINKYNHQLAPESMIPNLTKPGYALEPSLRQLSRMNEEQLKRVENFTIRNEFATVRFEGITDVRGLNLDKIVNFAFRSVGELNLSKIFIRFYPFRLNCIQKKCIMKQINLQKERN